MFDALIAVSAPADGDNPQIPSIGCYTDSMSDTASHGVLQHDNDGLRHTLSLRDVETQLLAAGVPRSHRHVVRLCQSGALDAAKRPGATGDEWFVAPQSVPKVIGDLRAIEEARARYSVPQHAATGHDLVEKARADVTARASHSTPQPAMSQSKQEEITQASAPEPATSRYVAQLEKRIEEKDEVIGILRAELVQRNEEIVRRNERERETNILIRGLQNLVLRLQPGAPPSADVLDGDAMTGKREVQDTHVA
jgi:hypothetical protein